MINANDFTEVFESIMDSVKAKYLPGDTKIPVYEFGTYLELTKIHNLNDKIGKVNYPLVWLVWEAGENTEFHDFDTEYIVQPRIFICTPTNSDYRSEQRRTESFQKILYPIFNELKQQMINSDYLDSETVLIFKKSDHYYWGESLGFKKEKNILFDTLDAMEIKFSNLKVFTDQC